ncbi:MAG: alpha/beta fold hydrolase [Ruminiclostridium sp.]
MKTIYKKTDGKDIVLKLYDQQLNRLTIHYIDLYIDTSFGKTHLIETGNFNGIPLLVFHGGNATTAYSLLTCEFLFSSFHIYAVDTIGHPGKSSDFQ